MNKQEFKQKLENGFNIRLLAEQFNAQNNKLKCAGRIYELQKEIDVKWLAEKFNCDENELRQEIENHINSDAIYNFAVHYDIDLDKIDYEVIKQVQRKSTPVETYKVNDKLEYNGQIYTLVNTQQLGKSLVFVLQNEDGMIVELASKISKEAKRA